MTSERLADLLLHGPTVYEQQSFGTGGLQAGSGLAAPGKSDVRDPSSALAALGLSRQQPGEEQQQSKKQIDKKIAIYLTRAVLRIFSVPALQSYLNDVVVFRDGQANDGQCRIQCAFHRLPDEVHPDLIRILAAPRDPKLSRYVHKGTAHTGVELVVKPEDFGGEEIDYAF